MDEVRAWGHGPLSGTVRVVSPELITWTLLPLPPGRFFEGRVVFPKRLVPKATNTDDMDVLDSILSEEEAWAARADRERAVTRLVTQSSLFVLAASVAATVVLHILYGRDPKPDFTGDYQPRPPASYSPAELGYLWRRGKVGMDEVVATILDLAERGFLAIETSSPDESLAQDIPTTGAKIAPGPEYVFRRLEPSGDSVLKPHEKMVLDLLFESVAFGKDRLAFRDLKRWSKGRPRSFYDFLAAFPEAVRKTDACRSFFDERAQKVKRGETRAGGVLAFAGVIATSLSGNPFGLLASLGGLVLMIGGALIHRRTPEGSTDLAKWRAFCMYLLQFSSLDRATVRAFRLGALPELRGGPGSGQGSIGAA